MKMSLGRLSVMAVLSAAAVGLLLSPAARAKSTYDGTWSVVVITEAGNCDRAYRYGLRIENGKVRYEGESFIEIAGHISDSGAVKVSISRGGQSATGTGKLAHDSGAGTWRGKAGAGECSGRWEAEKRAGLE